MRAVTLFAALLALVALMPPAPPPVLAGTPQALPAGGAPRPHQAALLAHHGALTPHRAWTVAPGPLQPSVGKQGHFVFGYLPYWELDYDAFRWDLLTHLAWFAVELTGSGDVVDSHGFLNASTGALIAEAHANGVAVVLTATNFDDAQVGALCNSPALRQKAIEGLVSLIVAQGADGVNIDFEFVPTSAEASFVTFLSELKAAVAAAVPGGGHVSIAGPAVDWSGSYDYDQIAAAIDGLFIMAYGYHWSGGNPGPLCPLESGGVWGKHTLAWTVDDYVTWGGEGIRAKLIAGLPIYGYDWPSSDSGVPGTATGKGTAVVYSKAMKDGAASGWKWDDASKSPYYMYQSGGWHQVWADTAESLALRFEFAVDEQLGGVGFWALGYDAGDEALWAAVEQSYPPAVVGGEDAGAIAQDAGGVAQDAGGGDAAAGAQDVTGSADAGVLDSGGGPGGGQADGAGGSVDAGGPHEVGGGAGPSGGGVDAGGAVWGSPPDGVGAGGPGAPGGDAPAGDAPKLGSGASSSQRAQAADGGCAAGAGGGGAGPAALLLAALFALGGGLRRGRGPR